MIDGVQVLTGNPSGERLNRQVRDWLPEGDFCRICLKPNWVKHQQDERFPVRALVTSSALIDAVIEGCLAKYPRAESIVVGDVPLQSCDWERLAAQAGVDALMRKYAGRSGPHVAFLDLRRERFDEREGFLVPAGRAAGDPAGYREVVLDEASLLDPVSNDAARFRVSDYDPDAMVSSHRRAFHRYLISGSVLDSELVINLPKMKTHQKAGITGALKNLVGINGSKACLVHHRRGVDEFAPGTPWAVRCQVRVRERLQKRSRRLFAVGRHGWRLMKGVCGIHTEATREALAHDRLYTGSGSWYGNDTIWRMIYDLNRIVRRAPREGGRLAAAPQRTYVAIVDGLVSGEGNGPLQPLPVDSGVLIAGDDPFGVDMAMARLMGFDERRIPCLAHRREFGDAAWGAFDPATLSLRVDGEQRRGLDALRPMRSYLPPPGWRGHIERVPQAAEAERSPA